MAFIPAASGAKGLPGPTGRFIHRRVAWVARRTPAQADGTRSNCAPAFTQASDLAWNPPKHDSIGKVQDVLPSILAQASRTGKRAGLLAQASTCLTTAVETAWLAAG